MIDLTNATTTALVLAALTGTYGFVRDTLKDRRTGKVSMQEAAEKTVAKAMETMQETADAAAKNAREAWAQADNARREARDARDRAEEAVRVAHGWQTWYVRWFRDGWDTTRQRDTPPDPAYPITN